MKIKYEIEIEFMAKAQMCTYIESDCVSFADALELFQHSLNDVKYKEIFDIKRDKHKWTNLNKLTMDDDEVVVECETIFSEKRAVDLIENLNIILLDLLDESTFEEFATEDEARSWVWNKIKRLINKTLNCDVNVINNVIENINIDVFFDIDENDDGDDFYMINDIEIEAFNVRQITLDFFKI